MLTQPVQAEPGGRKLTEAESTECSINYFPDGSAPSAAGAGEHTYTRTLHAWYFSTFYLMNLQWSFSL